MSKNKNKKQFHIDLDLDFDDWRDEKSDSDDSNQIKNDAWRKTDDETSNQYSAFTKFLEQDPPRKLEKIIPKIDYCEGHIRKLCRRKNWFERAADYDEHIVKKRLEKREYHIEMAYARIFQNLPEIMDAAIHQATEERNVRMIRDLLDRATGKHADALLKSFDSDSKEEIEEQIDQFLNS